MTVSGFTTGVKELRPEPRQPNQQRSIASAQPQTFGAAPQRDISTDEEAMYFRPRAARRDLNRLAITIARVHKTKIIARHDATILPQHANLSPDGSFRKGHLGASQTSPSLFELAPDRLRHGA
jgi:hypothetical protein